LKNASLFHRLVSFASGRRAYSDGKLTQDWIATSSSEFAAKRQWLPNSSDVNPFDYYVWGVEHYTPKPKNIDGLKKVLQLI